MRNTVAKKQTSREGAESAYLFGKWTRLFSFISRDTRPEREWLGQRESDRAWRRLANSLTPPSVTERTGRPREID